MAGGAISLGLDVCGKEVMSDLHLVPWIVVFGF